MAKWVNVMVTIVNDKGKPDGLNVDLIKAVAKELGMSIKIRVKAWDNAPKKLSNNKINVQPMMAYSDTIALTLARASLTTEAGAFSANFKPLSIKSIVLAWWQRTTPEIFLPVKATSKPCPRTRLVTGATKASNIFLLKTAGDSTSAGRCPICSWPDAGSKSVQMRSPRLGI